MYDPVLSHHYHWLTHSKNGTEIISLFWDWCCMEKIICDYREILGLSDEEAHLKFWDDVKNYDPEYFADCTSGRTLEEAIGDGVLDEIRADYLGTQNIECKRILEV